MRRIIQHFGFALSTLLSAICLLGCSAQLQNSGNVAQTEIAKSPQILSSLPGDQKPNFDLVKELDLQINGVSTGTSESIVLKKLGKPLQIKKGEFDECGGGFKKILHYSGLVIDLLSNEKGQDFSIVSIEVTSPEWLVTSGVSVGADAKDVEAKLGQPYGKEERNGQMVFFYVIKGNDGWINLFFRDNKLVQVSWSLTLC